MKFCVEWETCFCEDYPELYGVDEVEAQSEFEAREKVLNNHFHIAILNVYENERGVENDYS